jgi:hypothetical protein
VRRGATYSGSLVDKHHEFATTPVFFHEKLTALPAARAGAVAANRGSIRTVPVNHSAGPFADG